MQKFNKPGIFLFTILFLTQFVSSSAFAIVVFVGPKHTEIEIDGSTTVAAFREMVAKNGFDPASVILPDGKKLAAFDEGVTLITDLNIQKESSFKAVLGAPIVKKETKGFDMERLREFVSRGDIGNMMDTLSMVKDAEKAMNAVTHCTTRDGRNPLYVAARVGEVRAVDEIRRQVGEVNFRALLRQWRTEVLRPEQGHHRALLEKQTILHAAVRSGSPDMVRYILDAYPALRNVRNSLGCTAFDTAILFGQHQLFNIGALRPDHVDPGYASYPIRVREDCQVEKGHKIPKDY